MATVLKSLSLLLGLVGLVVVFLEQVGLFVDEDRVDFAELFLSSTAPIGRDKHAFGDFVRAFPPTAKVEPRLITGIATVSAIDIETTRGDATVGRSSVSKTRMYKLADGTRVGFAADPWNVRDWATETTYGWWGLAVALVCWFVTVAIHVSEVVAKKRARRMPSGEA